MEGHRHGDRHINAYHANLHAMDKVARCVAITREDGRPIPVFVLVNHLQRRLEVVHPHNTQPRPKDLFAIDPHLRFHMVEQTSSKEKPLPLGQRVLTTVDDKVSALLFSVLNISSDTLQMGFGDKRT